MGLFQSSSSRALPPQIAQTVALSRGEHVLAHATDEHTGHEVVLTTWAVVVVPRTGGPARRRPWSEVSAGAWEPQTRTVSVTWADGARPGQWMLGAGGSRVAEVLRERVQASIVLSEQIEVGGRLCARVAIRKNLATGELFDQVVLARGVRPDDPELVELVNRARAELKDQTGL